MLKRSLATFAAFSLAVSPVAAQESVQRDAAEIGDSEQIGGMGYAGILALLLLFSIAIFVIADGTDDDLEPVSP